MTNPPDASVGPLLREDVGYIVRRLPRRVQRVLRRFPGQVFLAGGYIRALIEKERPNDIDLLVGSKELASQVALILAEGDCARVYSTDNAYTIRGYRPAVQVIHRWLFDDPFLAIDSFDFTIACAAVWFDPVQPERHAWRGVCADRFYADLAAKRLVYRMPQREEEPGGSLLRVLKFYQRGYRIPLNHLGAIIARTLKGVDFEALAHVQGRNSPADLEEYVARIITGRLYQVDPLEDPDHEAHLPRMEEPT